MVLLKFFLFLVLKGFSILADESTTSIPSDIQLWRAQGDFDEDVLTEFYDRARFTEEIWKRDNKTIDFLLYKNEADSIAQFLKEHNVTHRVLVEDVQGTVDEAFVKTFPTRRNAMSGDQFTWTAYPALNDINKYLSKLAATYPSYCKLTSIGTTAHRKPINMLKISNGNKGNPAILIDSGTHGRERTSVLSTLFLIESIVRNFTKQPDYIKKKDWHVIPVLNPDGYDYSINTDRLWRKNRRRLSGDCYGVDLNRNFDYNWGKKETSQDVCSPDFCGLTPFSEEETKAFKNVVDGKHYNGYISVHSAGSKVIYPFATMQSHHVDFGDHLQMTKQMALAMRKVQGTHFINGNVQSLGLPKIFGMAIDWMFYVMEIKHSYMIETRGNGGLDMLAANKILPAAKEVRAGILKFAEVLR